MRKLWIVTELFYPDETSTSYILSKISNKLVDKYEVNVITSSALYQMNKVDNNNSFLLDKGINIHKVQLNESDKNDIFQRVIRMFFLTFRLSFCLLKNVHKNDKVFIVTNPAPLLLIVSLLKKIQKFELCILVHDVFPENTIPSGIIKSKSSVFYKFLMLFFNRSYSYADSLIVLGRDMKEIMNNKLRNYSNIPKIEIIENWADTDNIVFLQEKPNIISSRHQNYKVTIQYAGNIGRTQGLIDFLRIFKESKSENCYLDFWGEGAIKPELIKYVADNKLNDRVTFYGVYARSDQNTVLNSTDISLVTLSDGMYGLGVPSKTYNIMAAGKPILYIGNLRSEVALMIKEENIGFCFEPKDEVSIKAFFDDLSMIKFSVFKDMGIRARLVAESIYNENTILEKYFDFL